MQEESTQDIPMSTNASISAVTKPQISCPQSNPIVRVCLNP